MRRIPVSKPILFAILGVETLGVLLALWFVRTGGPAVATAMASVFLGSLSIILFSAKP